MNTLIALTITSIIILFLGVFNLKKWILPFLITGMVVALGLEFADWVKPAKSYYYDMFITNHNSIAFGGLLVFSALLTILISVQYYKNETRSLEGIYSILIFSLLGGLIMISSGNLASFFIGLEILSISLYLLAGSHKTSFLSNEAAMKYFLMGSFAAGFLLFGIALVYGATGSLNYNQIYYFINSNASNLPLILKAGILLIATGMAFKVGAVPFHFWAPDVYHGSPTLITAYMVTTIKVAGFAALLQLTLNCFGTDIKIWPNTLALIAALSIVTGNLGALYQTRIKRMMAYSSIAHTGYILIALVSIQSNTPSILFYYSAAYISSNLAIFTVIIMFKQTLKNSGIESFNGLAKLNPLIAVCSSLAFLSLTGIPPLAGFMAKYFVFASAINYGYLWLTVIAVLGSVVSIFYYFRPIINIYMKEKYYDKIITTPLSITVLIFLTVCSIVLGLIPGWIFVIK